MSRSSARLCALTALLTLSACRDAAPPDPVVAVVDGEAVPRSVYVDALMEAQGDAFFPRFVERRLVEKRAAARGITVDPAAVEAAIEEEERRVVQGRFRGDAAAFAEQLSGYGLTIEDWRQGVGARFRVRRLVEQLLAAEVDEAQVQKLFDLRFGEGGVERRVSDILISTNPTASRFYGRAEYQQEKDAIVADARYTAAELRSKLAAGEDFAALAKARSDAPGAAAGGDLGTLWSGRFGQKYDDAIAALGVGEISPVIEGRDGFHVAQVTGIRKGAVYAGRAIRVDAAPPAPDGSGPDEAARFAAAKTRADAIKARLAAGEDFATVAKEVTDDPTTKASGGDLGKFAPGRLGEAVDPVLESLPIGDVSSPVRTDDGYVIVKLDERTWLPGQDKKVVRDIFIATDYAKVKARKLAGKLEEMARAKAEAVAAEARAGKDFATLARVESEDELSRRQGGALARFRVGALGEAVDTAVGEMAVGEVRVVRGEGGWHVLRLDAVVQSDFEKVRAALERELKQRPVKPEDVEAYLKRLREGAAVEKKF